MADTKLKKLELEIERTCLKSTNYITRSAWLMWDVALIPELSPVFAQQWDVLATYVRLQRRNLNLNYYVHNSHQHCLRNIEGRMPWLLQHWQWQETAQAGRLDTPFGLVDVTSCSRATLKDIAKAAWRIYNAGSDNRAKCLVGMHNETRQWWPITDVHASRFGDSQQHFIHRAVAVGSSPDSRSHRMDLPCECGEAHPVRQHWMRQCTSAGVDEEAPRNYLEASLAVRCVAIPSGITSLKFEVNQEIADCIAAAQLIDGTVYVGTDGGAYRHKGFFMLSRASAGVAICVGPADAGASDGAGVNRGRGPNSLQDGGTSSGGTSSGGTSSVPSACVSQPEGNGGTSSGITIGTSNSSSITSGIVAGVNRGRGPNSFQVRGTSSGGTSSGGTSSVPSACVSQPEGNGDTNSGITIGITIGSSITSGTSGFTTGNSDGTTSSSPASAQAEDTSIETRSFCERLTGFDQSSWAAELHAAIIVIMASASLTVKRKVHLLIDNAVVQKGINDIVNRRFTLPKFGFGLWHLLATTIRDHDLFEYVAASWVPAHGRHLDWACSAGISSRLARLLNDKADTICSESAKVAHAAASNAYLERARLAENFSRTLLRRLDDATVRWLKSHPAFNDKADKWCRCRESE